MNIDVEGWMLKGAIYSFIHQPLDVYIVCHIFLLTFLFDWTLKPTKGSAQQVSIMSQYFNTV